MLQLDWLCTTLNNLIFSCFVYTFRKMYRRKISSGNLWLRSPNHRSSKISLRLFHESTNPASTTQNHSNSINQLNFPGFYIDFITLEYQTLIPYINSCHIQVAKYSDFFSASRNLCSPPLDLFLYTPLVILFEFILVNKQ